MISPISMVGICPDLAIVPLKAISGTERQTVMPGAPVHAHSLLGLAEHDDQQMQEALAWETSKSDCLNVFFL